MAEIQPFRGLRYSAEAGKLDSLVAPPYDVIDQEQRESYAAQNPYNVVHLTLPESKPDDRSKFVKYARSAALLSEWRREGILLPEPAPALYRYTQTFSVDGSERLTRISLITLIRVEPFETGTVLPHEHTFPKHKEDRLRILEATRSHLESIFGLFEDDGGALFRQIAEAPVGAKVECVGDDGVTHRLEPIEDPETIKQLKANFKDKRIWIADGHHRYETALAFRQAMGDKTETIPEDFMVIALASMSDPGLVLLPTHRIVPSLANRSEEDLTESLIPLFEVERHHSANLVQLMNREASQGRRAFGVAVEGGKGLLLVPKNDAEMIGQMPGEGSVELKSLDVTVLHEVIFQQLLGLGPNAPVEYTRDAHYAVRQADQGGGVAFLMEPPTVDDMKKIALGGERMPQKSTFYYPKVLSGLVLWSLVDF